MNLTFILPKKMQDLKPYRDQRGIDKIERISQKIILKNTGITLFTGINLLSSWFNIHNHHLKMPQKSFARIWQQIEKMTGTCLTANQHTQDNYHKESPTAQHFCQ